MGELQPNLHRHGDETRHASMSKLGGPAYLLTTPLTPSRSLLKRPPAPDEFNARFCESRGLDAPSKVSRLTDADASCTERARGRDELPKTLRHLQDTLDQQALVLEKFKHASAHTVRLKDNESRRANEIGLKLAAEITMHRDEADQLRNNLQRQLEALESVGARLRTVTVERDHYLKSRGVLVETCHQMQAFAGATVWAAQEIVRQKETLENEITVLKDRQVRFETAVASCLCALCVWSLPLFVSRSCLCIYSFTLRTIRFASRQQSQLLVLPSTSVYPPLHVSRSCTSGDWWGGVE